jgi:hypothetical protein
MQLTVEFGELSTIIGTRVEAVDGRPVTQTSLPVPERVTQRIQLFDL